MIRSVFFRYFMYVISPTFWVSDVYQRQAKNHHQRGALINKIDVFFILVTICLLVALTFFDFYYLFVGAGFFAVSRCIEFFYVYGRNTRKHLRVSVGHSNLKYHDRIFLAIRTYTQLVLNYGILYFVLPVSWFSKPFNSIFDAIYFSGVTITTLGYGDFVPVHPLAKTLILLEVFQGFILLFVSLTVYMSLSLLRDRLH